MPGTEISTVLRSIVYCPTAQSTVCVRCYATIGTELGYAATRILQPLLGMGNSQIEEVLDPRPWTLDPGQ
eukprot:3049382-Rhodomonas_salina.1